DAITDVFGDYKFNGLAVGDYIVRVVLNTVTSSRPGAVYGAQIPVSTYHVDASSGTTLGVLNDVGGVVPSAADADSSPAGSAINVSTFQFTSGPSGFAQSASRVQIQGVSSVVSGVDFGVNFDVVVNANSGGGGSLTRVLANANALGNAGLAQQGLSAGI